MSLFHQPVKIGLTGGFGTGKSSTLKIFKNCGVSVLDADRLAHQAIKPGQPAYRQIVKQFGKGVLCPDRRIDRRKLGRIVFKDPHKLLLLGRMVHPPVLRRIKTFLRDCKKSGRRPCAVSIPLLYEKGLEKLFDVVVVVRTNPKEVANRVAKPRGLSREEILVRMKAQMPLAAKCRQADFVMDNNGSLEHLHGQVKEFCNSLARHPRML